MADQVWEYDQFFYLKDVYKLEHRRVRNPWWRRLFGKKAEVVRRPTEYKELFDGRP